MALKPITHADGTGYETMIPKTIEVISGPMVEILATDDEGNSLNLMVFDRQIKDLIDDLVKAQS